MTKTVEYRVWAGMKTRCTNQATAGFQHYGGRGITVCPEWQTSFQAFLQAVGLRPSPAHSIERVDNAKGYEPGNVIWATNAEQQLNKRTNRRLEWNGRTQTISQWADELGIKRTTLLMRLTKSRWSVHEALSTPVTAGNRWPTSGSPVQP